MNYLQNIPPESIDSGIPKVLLVRHEIIHIKHIFTELFHRKSLDIESLLNKVDMSLLDYITYMTQRIRRIHKINRSFYEDPNNVVSFNYKSFFPLIEMTSNFKQQIVLDYDGVITKNSFQELFKLCTERCETVVCSANPDISSDKIKSKYSVNCGPVYSNKGKKKKLRQLLLLHSRNDFTFFVDDEEEYLKIAWVFGVKTYQYKNNKITSYSLKTR
jgi:hypothetical protein